MRLNLAAMACLSAILITFTTVYAQNTSSADRNSKPPLELIASKHKQIYDVSCIPMSVEMLLKYNNCVDLSFYRLQDDWKNKTDGTFGSFDGRAIAGLKFKHQFNIPRGDRFPFDRLFNTINAELVAGRKVVISLPSGINLWHMYVIDRKTSQGEYVAYSRYYNDHRVIKKEDVKRSIYDCKGTDILTYTIVR